MSVLEIRGGFPHVRRLSADNSAGLAHPLPFTSKYLIIRVATAPCKVYFKEEDFTADANYILVPIAATTTPHGEWKGPVEAEKLWFKGSGGTSAIELVAFQRRG